MAGGESTDPKTDILVSVCVYLQDTDMYIQN